MGHLDGYFVPQGIEDADGAPNHVHGLGENIKDPIQGFLEVQILIERFADIVEQVDLLYFLHVVPAVIAGFRSVPDRKSTIL